MTKRRLLVLSAPFGLGHIKAGEALCQSYSDDFNGEARQVDLLRYVSPHFSRWIEEIYSLMAKHTPLIYRLCYAMSDRPGSPGKKNELLFGLDKYSALIDEFKPDAIISTHFFPAAIVSHMYPHFPVPNGMVVTDYVTHHYLVNRYTDLYFVGHRDMIARLKQNHVDEFRIRVTGIPVRSIFEGDLNRADMRHALGLMTGTFTLLVMGGGNALGPLADIIKTLGKLKDRIQVITVTGQNIKLFNQLKELYSEMNMRGLVLGYVDNVHEYMAASDLLISKAGGLTITEAMATGLPMIIIQPAPGQEKGNTSFLEKTGTGIHVKHVGNLNLVVGDLIKDPSKLQQMKHLIRKTYISNAAHNILLEMNKLIEDKSKTLQSVRSSA
jgi:processive 1,2-diacylglycerol beta-glucosyltransferase